MENLFIGYIDDDLDFVKTYGDILKNEGVEIRCPKFNLSKEQITNWIYRENLKAILVDYKLGIKYDFFGTELVAYLNSVFPDLQCLLLTGYRDQSIEEKLVFENMIIDREEFTENIEQSIDKIKSAVEVFDKRIEMRKSEYIALLEKKRNNTINNTEENAFYYLHNLLINYGQIDQEIPAELMKTEISKKIDSILEKLDELTK